jgi:hypothetical protein
MTFKKTVILYSEKKLKPVDENFISVTWNKLTREPPSVRWLQLSRVAHYNTSILHKNHTLGFLNMFKRTLTLYCLGLRA